MLRLVAIACVLVGHLGCYDPSVRDCSVTCRSAKECAAGQTCSGDGFCVSPTYRGRCERMATDAGVGDSGGMKKDGGKDSGDSGAVAACQAGCVNGACDENGVCVIDCSASGSCSASDVVCPAGLPCKVVCGDHACTHHVQCGMSTSCDVTCSGIGSCGDVIQCPIGRCNVQCSGDMSCHKNTKCSMSCACDVACTGSGACGDISECPRMQSCVLGRGCTSALSGCDTCQ